MARTDLEVSSFQKRPAYRYIRESDQVPPLGTEDGIARVKLFNPTGSETWYVSEYEPETRTAYGRMLSVYACKGDEYGYISMAELVEFRDSRFGLPIERDLHWEPRPLSKCN